MNPNVFLWDSNHFTSTAFKIKLYQFSLQIAGFLTPKRSLSGCSRRFARVEVCWKLLKSLIYSCSSLSQGIQLFLQRIFYNKNHYHAGQILIFLQGSHPPSKFTMQNQASFSKDMKSLKVSDATSSWCKHIHSPYSYKSVRRILIMIEILIHFTLNVHGELNLTRVYSCSSAIHTDLYYEFVNYILIKKINLKKTEL